MLCGDNIIFLAALSTFGRLSASWFGFGIETMIVRRSCKGGGGGGDGAFGFVVFIPRRVSEVCVCALDHEIAVMDFIIDISI